MVLYVSAGGALNYGQQYVRTYVPAVRYGCLRRDKYGGRKPFEFGRIDILLLQFFTTTLECSYSFMKSFHHDVRRKDWEVDEDAIASTINSTVCRRVLPTLIKFTCLRILFHSIFIVEPLAIVAREGEEEEDEYAQQ